jgi:hypothetical protein
MVNPEPAGATAAGSRRSSWQMLQKLGLVFVGAFIAVAATQAPLLASADESAQPPRPALINHMVFFQLNDAADLPELRADCDELAGAIPGVTSYFSGLHLDTGRDTVDGDYSLGFYVGFDSAEDYAAYVAHEAHKALVAKWMPRLQWLRVYDVIDESP